jgi:hypothetical protein
MPAIVVEALDQIAAKYGRALENLGQRDAIIVMARALNHTGDKARTKVKRALAEQTGIQYGKINGLISSKRAQRTGAGLEYAIVGKRNNTNLSLFKARETSTGISAYPWKKLHQFKGGFLVARYGGKAYRRKTHSRFPLTTLDGPNVVKELVKDASAQAFESTIPEIIARVAHELKRVLEARG